MKDIYVYDDVHVLKNKLHIKDKEALELAEADLLSSRIKKLDGIDADLEIGIELFEHIHFFLFQDLFEWAGEFRQINIEKSERALGGLTVNYTEHSKIQEEIEKVFDIIKSTDITSLDKEGQGTYIADIMSRLWLIHPFREGNTRTVLIFMFKYLERNNININKDMYRDSSQYVRDALVAATFEDVKIDVYANNKYLLEFVRNSLK